MFSKKLHMTLMLGVNIEVNVLTLYCKLDHFRDVETIFRHSETVWPSPFTVYEPVYCIRVVSFDPFGILWVYNLPL